MSTTIFPELRWAQRSSATDPEKNKLWITVAVADLIESDVQTTDTTFKFTGRDAHRSYAVEFELYDEIDASLTREARTQQKVLVESRKKKAQTEYWPRLTKDSKRRPFIRTDFDKWVDEDEQNEQPEEDPMAGLGGMGMPGMAGGMGGGDPSMDQSQAMLGGAGGDTNAQMEQLQQLLANANKGGAGAGAGGDLDDEEEENDETTSELGKAQD